jgi:hypothetical protein
MNTNQVVIKDVPWGDPADQYVVYSIDMISEEQVNSFLEQEHVHGCDDYAFFANMLATYLNLATHNSHASVGDIISSQIRTAVVKDIISEYKSNFVISYNDNEDRWVLAIT